MLIEFTKMHGLGNDFIVINAISQSIDLSADQIIKLCDRHFGIGCDQLLLVEKSSNVQAEFRYRIFNADGGEVEQCGNGARCFALFVHQQGLTTKTNISVETASGLIKLKVEAEQVTVDMGIPDFQPESLPFLAEKQAETYNLMVNDAEYTIAAVSMGNPHAVMQVDNLEAMEINGLGGAIESHVLFPNRVNAGFMQIINRDEIRLRVFERGVGETQACGTGACAAVAVGRMLGLLNEAVTVHLNGGNLLISWREQSQPLLMTGPATSVFDGKINIDSYYRNA